MRSKGTNRVALAASFLALGLFTLVWWKTNLWYRQELLTGQRAHVTAELAPYGNVLSGAINGKLGILNGLKAFVEPHLSEPSFAPEFERFAAGLYAATTGIRVITVAPGAIPRYVYPLSGNESIIGHDPTRDPRPDVRADVERAIHSREITLSGPDELRPRGVGLIARLSVYRDRTFWGFVTIAFDLENLLRESGLQPGPAALRLALRVRSGRVFFGDRAVFDGEPIIYRVELAEGFWELAAIPRGGWHASIHEPLAVFNGAALIIVLALTMLVYLGVNREARLTLEVKKRTEESYQAQEELRKAREELEIPVQERTAKLEKLNQALQADIVERKRAEKVCAGRFPIRSTK